jgi:hypothetical protein
MEICQNPKPLNLNQANKTDVFCVAFRLKFINLIDQRFGSFFLIQETFWIDFTKETSIKIKFVEKQPSQFCIPVPPKLYRSAALAKAIQRSPAFFNLTSLKS